VSYSSWPTQLKMPLDLDGSMILYYNNSNIATRTIPWIICTSTQVANFTGESPAKDVNFGGNGNQDLNFCILFPELRDVTGLLVRKNGSSSGIDSIATSPDTTNGIDGTWNTPTQAGTFFVQTGAVDWWRSNAPGTLSGANSLGVRALYFHIARGGDGGLQISHIHVFGSKSSGQTADDLQFLDSDGTTVSTKDYDFGDIAAGGTTSDTTIYVKNASGTKIANNVLLSFYGSNPGDYLLSTDGGGTFLSSATLATIAAGATQQVIVRCTTPSVASGNATPRAAVLRAAAGSWT
jgi:hypothetical protein